MGVWGGGGRATPSTAHLLLTAASLTGTPVLSAAVPGYELQVVGNQLQLNQVITDPYVTWSGGAAFGTDTNNDGIANGLAWLLGAANKDANATASLPNATQLNGALILNFTCLKSANRGNAALKVQYSRDLGQGDAWHEVIVPGDSGGIVGVVTFIPSANADPALINMQATIPVGAATPGNKLFGRLNAVSAP